MDTPSREGAPFIMASPPMGPEARARAQVANLTGLFALSTMMMVDGREESDIIRLALSAVPTLGRCRAVAGYLDGPRLERLLVAGADPGPGLDEQVAELAGEDGRVRLPGLPWAWALSLPGLSGHGGYLVVGCQVEPTADEQFMLRVLVQQARTALTNAALHRREREAAAELRRLNDEAIATNRQLTETVAELQRQTRVHDVLAEVAASGGGEQGIAMALHELTGRPVAVEDRFGNLRCWAGPDEPAPYPRLDPLAHDELLRQAGRRGRSVPDRDRLIAVAQPGGEVLGVLALIDPDASATGSEVFALEHAATVLALELVHQRNLAEVELRLRGDVVDDLTSGTDAASAFARAAALGYDLHGTHHVTVVQWYDRPIDQALAKAVERAAGTLRLAGLLARRSGVVVLITHQRPTGRDLYAAVCRQVGSTEGGIGISGRCDAGGLPGSFHEAMRALEARKVSRTPQGATAFDEMGIYRLLSAGSGAEEIAGYVHQWLGSLLEYDDQHNADLVQTLSQYLDCGGNYDATAEALAIHRSTLRYRLQRIREVSGLDLGDVESRLNLHLATRAWRVLRGTA